MQRRQFAKAQWQSMFERLLEDVECNVDARGRLGRDDGQGSASQPIELRELFIWSWCTLMAMPFTAAQDYAKLEEGEGGGGGLAALVRKVRAANFRCPWLRTAKEVQLTWTAAFVRAFDEDLSGVSFWPTDPANWTPDEWRPAGYPCFVVPVHRPYRLENLKGRERRAALHHTILPATVGELEVDLILHEMAVGSSADLPQQWTYGAATFEDLTVDFSTIPPNEFLLTGAPAPDADRQVASHLSSARAAHCDVVAWPELTMPEKRLATLRARLKSEVFLDQFQVPIIASGTWHVTSGKSHVNRLEVLDGRGRGLLTYDKRLKYPFKGHFEAIEPGSRVPVLVMKNRLVSFAICRDFCDDGPENVYRALGVDLIVIPSMGDGSTTAAHLRHAKAIQSLQGSVMFLVQQAPVLTGGKLPAGKPPAFSLAVPLDASLAQPAGAENQLVPFRSLQARL